MVTITNGIKTFRVTAGSVKQFESMGFITVSNKKNGHFEDSNKSNIDNTGTKDIEENTEDSMNTEDKMFIEEILEKPLSQWTGDEMKEFVRIKGIDTSGAQKVSQVRSIIKTYLDEEQKKNS